MRSLSVLLVALTIGVPAQAAAVARVDDTGTVVSQPVVPMKWQTLVPGRGGNNTVEAQLHVALRLNLGTWLNQPVRLYMVLPPGAGNSVQARWRTQGRLLPGMMRSGGRALVYEGVVAGRVLEETIELSLETDGRTLTAPQTMQFYFEVETR